jgi:uncharacterized membrane protein HdeD (DUF308 family)
MSLALGVPISFVAVSLAYLLGATIIACLQFRAAFTNRTDWKVFMAGIILTFLNLLLGIWLVTTESREAWFNFLMYLLCAPVSTVATYSVFKDREREKQLHE